MTKANFDARMKELGRATSPTDAADAIGRFLGDGRDWLLSLPRAKYAMTVCTVIFGGMRAGMSDRELQQLLNWHRIPVVTDEEIDSFGSLVARSGLPPVPDDPSPVPSAASTFCTACNKFVDDPCHPGPAPDVRPDSAAPTASARRAETPAAEPDEPTPPENPLGALGVFALMAERVAQVTDYMVLRSNAWADTKFVDWTSFSLDASPHVNVRTGLVQHLMAAEKAHAADDREGVDRHAVLALLWAADYLVNCLGARLFEGIDTVKPYVDGD